MYGADVRNNDISERTKKRVSAKIIFLQVKPNENTAILLIKRMDSGAFKAYNFIVK